MDSSHNISVSTDTRRSSSIKNSNEICSGYFKVIFSGHKPIDSRLFNKNLEKKMAQLF